MNPYVKLFGVACVWGCMATTALEAQAPDPPHSCLAREWSPPRLLDESGDSPLEITQASLVPGPRGDAYVVGRGPSVYTDSGVYVKVPFVAYHIAPDGTPTRLGAPAFAGDFAGPRGGVVGDTLRVFWGEPDSTATIPAPRAQHPDIVRSIRGLWTASYANSRWSPPRFVTGRFAISWMFSNGWARPDWSPDASLALIGVRSRGDWTTTWLTAAGTTTLPDLDFGPLYASLLSPAPSHLVYVYIANDRSVPNDHNSVFAIHSTDGGQSWSTPVRIALSGQQMAKHVTVVKASSGSLHAIWLRSMAGETFGGRVIGHAVSRDTGRTWSAPEYWDPRAPIWTFKAASDRHDRIHLVYQVRPAGQRWPMLMHTSRGAADTTWATPTRLFGDTVWARMPQLTRTATGDLLLLFAKHRSTAGDSNDFDSAISFLRDGNPCMPNE